jgi:hypothetical protein
VARISVSAVAAFYRPTGVKGESAVFIRERGEVATMKRFTEFTAAQQFARDHAAQLTAEGHKVDLQLGHLL